MEICGLHCSGVQSEAAGDPVQDDRQSGVSNKKGVTVTIVILRGSSRKAAAIERKGNKKCPIAMNKEALAGNDKVILLMNKLYLCNIHDNIQCT
jgi:hypothetical protein